MYNALMTVLVLKGICSKEEAEAIADKLNTAVVPAKFKDAYTEVEYVLKDVLDTPKK